MQWPLTPPFLVPIRHIGMDLEARVGSETSRVLQSLHTGSSGTPCQLSTGGVTHSGMMPSQQRIPIQPPGLKP